MVSPDNHTDTAQLVKKKNGCHGLTYETSSNSPDLFNVLVVCIIELLLDVECIIKLEVHVKVNQSRATYHYLA